MQNAEVVFCLGVESYWLYRFLLLLLLFCGFFFSLNEEVTNWNNLYLIWDSLFAIVNLSQVTCFLKLLDQCSYDPLPGHLWNCEGVRNSYWVGCKRCTVLNAMSYAYVEEKDEIGDTIVCWCCSWSLVTYLPYTDQSGVGKGMCGTGASDLQQIRLDHFPTETGSFYSRPCGCIPVTDGKESCLFLLPLEMFWELLKNLIACGSESASQLDGQFCIPRMGLISFYQTSANRIQCLSWIIHSATLTDTGDNWLRLL